MAAPAPATVLIEAAHRRRRSGRGDPEDAQRIELTGLHLVPGLTDGFATFDPDHDALWLSAGVTRVRDGGSPVGEMVPERAPGMRDRHPGPDLLIGSPIFVSSTSGRGDGFVLGPAEQAAEQVAELLELMGNAGATFDYFQHDGSLDGTRCAWCARRAWPRAWSPGAGDPRADPGAGAGGGPARPDRAGVAAAAGARFETLTEAEVKQLDAASATSPPAGGGSPMSWGRRASSVAPLTRSPRPWTPSVPCTRWPGGRTSRPSG